MSRGTDGDLPFCSQTRKRGYELGKTNDWGVVYFDDGDGERKCTVVTEHQGELTGKRVVRGREKECAEYYSLKASSTS